MKLDRNLGVSLLKEMLRIRRFEEKCAELYSGGRIRGFLHLYIGEEAVAAGAMRAFAPEDAILATYREHGHALARGIAARSIMAEMYGKQEGCSRGRGGSMHIFDAATRFYGGNAIVAGGLPLAVGFALADRLRGRQAVSACFFGEGAVAEGEFHESLNLAALWKVPALFLCENNRYAMGTALERSEADTDLCEKARSYSVQARSVDGMDVTAVMEATAQAAAEVRSGGGPQFIEYRTYRFRAHSMFDPELYRNKREVEHGGGHAVKRGQVVAVVETQKGAIEVEIWEDGIVDRLLARTGAKVPVGQVLALVRGADEAAGASAPASAAAPGPTPAPPPAEVSAAVALAAPPTPAAGSHRVRISPAARRLADEMGVAIDTVQPAEPEGVVSREDVQRAAQSRDAARAVAAPSGTGKQPAADWHAQMRRAIAAAMSRSKREIPHYYLAHDIDVTRVTDWLSAENLKRGVAERLLPVVPLMKAVALALREVPELNGFWTEDGFRPSPAVHLGMAIAMRGGGLVAPAIHDADRRNLSELMADLRDLIARVRGGRLRSSQMSDPTITLTSLGEQGVESVFPVIYPPQVAIVGLGKTTDRPWVENGAVVPCKVLTATLAADHRVSDGHRGGLFLARLASLLQEPENLI